MNRSFAGMGEEWRMNLGLSRLIGEAMAVPAWEYAILSTLIAIVLLYHVLDFHFVGDLLTGLRGDKVELVYSPFSRIAGQILAKSQFFNRRYWPTPWLCSPHLQTAFVHFHGRPPKVTYRRELFVAPDGGTTALDWLDPESSGSISIQETPIVIIVPGLSSESSNAYMKHLAHGMVNQGWRAVVINHRGLGGVTLTSERFYHAGWTSDLRWFIQDLHKQFPKALLLAVGTSLGANILVKYLGEEGENTLLGGAVSICNPWDLVVCDRFIARKPVQKLYDKAVATGLTDFVHRHSTVLSSMDNWNFIRKSRSIRTFDHLFTITVGKFETVDDYYRRSSSAHLVGSVAVPLLAVNSRDDPLCTKEAIPWDECRLNPNVLLAVTRHGGHLAYFEGLTAKSIWWVRAIEEFFQVIVSSSPVPVSEDPSPQPVSEPLPVVAAAEEPSTSCTTVEPDVAETMVLNEEEIFSEESSRELEFQPRTAAAELESSISMDEEGLSIHLCLKTRQEMLALQRALSSILEEPTSKKQQKLEASTIGTKQALLLLAVPLVGSALALGLRRKYFEKLLRRII
ncbi:phospholipase ABHD3 [Selaginella moellendorffii]|uniref:phospholipase ABHD3 n=1 Tax=Selaginella moellendorffii TaxID=88036 RepID=UPI000D1C8235|nr:phospholipase ABHD3 [Selaginella moellendorffii]|eukprot:XP_024530780.1 phospholipase ABHD3 [Selaginella moellendorffii]